jgi:membrane-associated phospholipid phosphatase
MQFLQSIDLVLFRNFAAGFDPNPGVLYVALLTSQLASWMIVAVVGVIAFRSLGGRIDALLALMCAGLINLLSHTLAAWFDTPRPFMVGLSPDYAAHGGRGGFPSTHACVIFAMAVFMAWRPHLRVAAGIVAFLATATSLARIYLGVHFPLDVLGGLLVGAIGGTAFAALRNVIDFVLSSARRRALA